MYFFLVFCASLFSIPPLGSRLIFETPTQFEPGLNMNLESSSLASKTVGLYVLA